MVSEGVPLVETADGIWGRFRAAAAEGGGNHVVSAVVEDAVLVCHHHAVVLHQVAEVGSGSGGGHGLRTLIAGQVGGGYEVAVGDIKSTGAITIAYEGLTNHALGHAGGGHE